MTHWSTLTTEQRIERMKAHWEPGLPASQWADLAGAPSRNAIIGMLQRHAEALAPCHLTPRTRKDKPSATRSQGGKISKERLRARLRVVDAPVPENVVFGAPHVAAVDLMMLNGHRCKWPLNEGGPFIFCGEATNEGRSYCAYHATAAVGQGTESERSAHRVARQLAA